MESEGRPELNSIASGTGAILLAAGGGSRFSSTAMRAGLVVPHKLVAPLRGTTVFQLALRNVVEAGFETVIVVTGAVELPGLDETKAEKSNLRVVHNARWSQGQATSLNVGLDEADRVGLHGVVCGLGDQPFILPSDWAAVADAGEASPIAVATYDGKRRNPVYLNRSVWSMVPTVGDEGARSVIAAHPELVTEVACWGSAADIDTPEDLLRWS